jgi:hypothetical protein
MVAFASIGLRRGPGEDAFAAGSAQIAIVINDINANAEMRGVRQDFVIIDIEFGFWVTRAGNFLRFTTGRIAHDMNCA